MNNKSYIMLDIDGVLVTTMQYYTNRKKWHPMYDCYRFDETCVKVFNKLTEKTNPIVILSSDWKDHYTVDQMNQIFDWNGIISRVSDVTPKLWKVKYTNLDQLEECRANEILLYVNEHQITRFVAIDDLDLSPWIPNNFVRTPRANEGIKQSGVKDKILNIINHD